MFTAFALALAQDKPAPVVAVDRDDIEVRASCTLDFGGRTLVDDEGDGVVKILGDGLTITCKNALVGAPPGATPDAYTGIGLRITGKHVTLRGAVVRGFKGAIWASGADGLVLEDCDVSGNYRAHLRSTPQAEAGEDWLFPHENDANEWLTNYGAGIYVEESSGVTIRGCRARAGQNGICLRRVDDSRIYDNDMSFLSGWGLALYRSSRNVVDHNSFDFCVRGYSHGVYWRGQDSAGILAFELCSDNVFAANSATHGGDGFFGFAGLDALDGVVGTAGAGCNRNVFVGNDFADSPANAIEMTFSFGNVYVANDLSRANQHGIWGGYSHDSLVLDNVIEDCVEGGISVEHGSDWRITGNRFARNARAIELWWDEDKDLLAKPWGQLNPTTSERYRIDGNRFDGDRVQLELRGGTKAVRWDPAQSGSDSSRWKVDAQSEVEDAPADAQPPLRPTLPPLPGRRVAVGARKELTGRDKIIMTEWGPYDWVAPYLQRVDDRDGAHVWRLLGDDAAQGATASEGVLVRVVKDVRPPQFVLTPREAGAAVPYTLTVRAPGRELVGSGVLLGNSWHVTVGKWSTDPRTDAAAWRREVAAGVSFDAPRLVLRYGSGGPSELADAPRPVKDAHLGGNQFGTLASTHIQLPKGRWKLATTSDDGVRVRVDGVLKIDNWTHHGPTADAVELEFAKAAKVALEVEHFELDGWAVLELELVPLD